MALWLYDHFWGYLELPSSQRKPLNNTTEGALRLELATEKKNMGRSTKPGKTDGNTKFRFF